MRERCVSLHRDSLGLRAYFTCQATDLYVHACLPQTDIIMCLLYTELYDFSVCVRVTEILERVGRMPQPGSLCSLPPGFQCF